MIKGVLVISNVYTENNRTAKFVTQKLVEMKEDKPTVILEDFSAPLSTINRITEEKTNKFF